MRIWVREFTDLDTRAIKLVRLVEANNAQWLRLRHLALKDAEMQFPRTAAAASFSKLPGSQFLDPPGGQWTASTATIRPARR
jgi:hypothetical protein